MRTREISPDFTIEDIHAVREEFYERTKDMSSQEFVAYCRTLGREAGKGNDGDSFQGQKAGETV